MKNQWFGDVSDYRKYGLLRLISNTTHLNIGVCWMLTEKDDKGTSYNRLQYLRSPQRWRHYDENLYDFLYQRVIKENSIEVAAIENNDILPVRTFYSEKLSDDSNRPSYFERLKQSMRACDVLFIDTDNGMEISSVSKIHKHSSKYLYWDEARDLYKSGYSLLIFQYNRRNIPFCDILKQLYKEFETKLGTRPECYYSAGYGKVFLISHDKHKKLFAQINKEVESHWHEKMRIGSDCTNS